MRKVLAVLATLAVATGVVVFSQPAAAVGAPVAPPARHPTTRVCPDDGRLLACLAIRQTDTVQPNLSANVLPSGFGPADLRNAYNLTTTGSSAMTVAIIDAFDDPKAESDLATYRSTFGLPPCTTANGCFQKVNQNGQTSSLPATSTNWAGEISLDLDMVSAICPGCHILLVEANSSSIGNLGTAVNTAVSMGAKFVSNSYGGSGDGSASTFDNSYYNHPGVVITASSGDDGFGVSYPASGRGVTAVGGTSLVRDSSARGWSETVWNGAGSGCSTSVAKPAFQVGLNTGCSKRAEADVSAVADPQTGVAVYQTFGASGWTVYGGTSVAAPIIASVYALAGNPGPTDSANSYPYAQSSALNDVTSGNNGTCGTPLCTAGAGYDGPTGLGTPRGTSAFARPRTASSTTLASSANPAMSGQAVTFTAAVTSTAGTPTGNVTFSSDGNPLGTTGLASGRATLTTSALPAGTHTITADYAGDTSVAPSSATLAQTVNAATTTTTLTASINPSLPGEAVTFTATVTSPEGSPTGTVTFASDGNPLGTIGLTSGQATLSTSALTIGDHTIAATYTPDANFLTSSTSLAFTVSEITYATRTSTTVPNTLSTKDLQSIYNCQVTTIQPMLPQFGSSTRNSFLTSLGFADAADFTSQPGHTCVKQVDASGNPLLENTGNLLTAANQIEPYSIAAFIAQSSGQELDVHGVTMIGKVNNVPPLLLNTASTLSNDVFNVVPNSQIDSGSQTNQVFVGPNSQVCTNTDTIKKFGFGVNANCGSTSIQTPP